MRHGEWEPADNADAELQSAQTGLPPEAGIHAPDRESSHAAGMGSEAGDQRLRLDRG